MTRFTDGPAINTILDLERSPLFLRVVVATSADGVQTVDALDKLDDVPHKDEAIHAYFKVADDGWMHLSYTEKKTGRRRGRTVKSATYTLYSNQPTDDVMRLAEKWREWCGLQMQILGSQPGGES
jgi:hypothetical protein